MSPAVVILIIIFLILFNAFFASIEISLVSLSENKINLETKKNNPKALKIKKIKEKPTKFLTVIQVMIHILTFFQGSILNSYLFVKNNNYSTWDKYLIEAIVIILSIILGEIIPKRIALTFPLGTANLLLNLFNVVCFITKPLVWFLNSISNMILYLLSIDPNKKESSVGEDELRYLLNSSYRTGIIDINENNMIQNIFDFNRTIVSDIMRHRKEIVAINSNITKEELISFISREKYTRFPVYEKNIDKIIGIVHVKDLFKGLLGENKKNTTKEFSSAEDKNFNIKKFLRKAHFVMEFQNINELFKEMKLKQNHIAIVVDEYGGTSGIVTIEDVIEEILGDIRDEYDKKNVQIIKISNKEYIIKGTTHLTEVEDNLKINLPTNDYETLSGFLLGQLKKMPENDEKIEIIYNNWQFKGLTYDGLVITKVKITQLPNLPSIIKN
ncbi:hemolysin family protein [Texas Phoenix palm phytoplasma]|uniref:hemolysin family protein n=1 Tax=Texas Phoenix palm phytoplasma TaxID=176709 RepID=UPI00280A8FBC|nr:hemolysin family protein [Texas Phoenix palm phytoplasma]